MTTSDHDVPMSRRPDVSPVSDDVPIYRRPDVPPVRPPTPPYPLGAHEIRGGVRFAVVSTAARVRLVLDPGGEGRREIELDPRAERTGRVWHLLVEGLAPPVAYAWRVAGDGGEWSEDLLDPYGVEIGGWPSWGGGRPAEHRTGHSVLPAGSRSPGPRRVAPAEHPVDRVIYELSVRGYTSDPSAEVSAPGTFRGFLEKIPHLRRLGITTVELLPVHAWNEQEVEFTNPFTGDSLRNLWGYSPLSFFAPHPGLASGSGGSPSEELRELVDQLHEGGLEVFLDVVYNHTGEKRLDPARREGYSLAALAPFLYYRFGEDGRRLDFTGCGNTLDTSEPVVQDLVVDSLRHLRGVWGFDGFRFDLAPVLTRGAHGEREGDPPMVRRISRDPVLAQGALIAEAWDAAGLYRVGEFPSWGPWSEWNDRYRDGVRRFLRGDEGMAREMALRLAGSPDLYGKSALGPGSSINFVTCHDGFTLADLVSFSEKRNLENGEENRDGNDANWSSGYGAEGDTEDPVVLAARRRQVRNFLVTLLVSQGVPMLLGGDELGNSQGGNNNAYCQDGPTGWVRWDTGTDSTLPDLVARLTAFRKSHPTLRRRTFPEEDLFGGRTPFRWHAEVGAKSRRLEGARGLALELLPDGAPGQDVPLYLAWNPTPTELAFELPEGSWIEILDTAAEPPWREPGEPREGTLGLVGRSCRVLVGGG